ncbi:MAG: hypothetical protein C0502_04240 [Opitutus sp.]|nr:hypothetical protein [Opitutus sp.]
MNKRAVWLGIGWFLGIQPFSWAEQAIEFGVELSADATVGLRGWAQTGESLHGLALIHGEWGNAPGDGGASSCRAHVSILGLAGRGPTGRFVGDLLTISNSEGHESLRLYASWWESNREAWNVRAGLLLADEEFGYSDAGGELINASFGWPIFISANTRNTGPAFFAAGLGVRIRWDLDDRRSFRIGFYDGDTLDSPEGDPAINRDGLRYRLNGEQGLFTMAEFNVRLAGRTRFKLGAWAHTGDFADLYRDPGGGSFVLNGTAPRVHPHNFGGYAVLEHAIVGTPGEQGGVDGYVRFGAAPPDRNAIHWAFDLGSAWHGPLPSRPEDVFTLGFSYARHSDSLRRASMEAEPSLAPPDYEHVIELAYRWTISEALSVQPDLQYIRHPGGSAMLRDALVLLVRVKAVF